jgi:hypothetical protein
MRSHGPMFVIEPLLTNGLFPDRKQLRNSRVFTPVRDQINKGDSR